MKPKNKPDVYVYQKDHCTVAVNGHVDFSNAAAVRYQGSRLIDTLPEVVIDLSSVTKSDSSCLAVISSWLRDSKQQHKKITITKTPKFLLDLGRVCGVSSILPIKK